MTEFVLHFGLPRTGTTSIQNFMAANREALLAQGILYPEAENEIPDHDNFKREALQLSTVGTVNHLGLAMELMADTPYGPAASHAQPLWNALFDRADATGVERIVLSYEVWGLSPRRFDFTPILDRFGDRHTRRGIAYLRPFEIWMVSLYEQTIRSKNRKEKTLTEFGPFRMAREVGFVRRLGQAKKRFKLDGIDVVDFDMAIVDDGLTDDFLARIGVTDKSQLTAPVRLNSAYHKWQTLFMRLCNQREISDETFLKLRRVFAVASRRKQVLAELRPGLDTATPEERAILRAVEVRDAPLLEERYETVLTRSPNKERPYREMDQEDVQTILAGMESHLSEAEMKELSTLRA